MAALWTLFENQRKRISKLNSSMRGEFRGVGLAVASVRGAEMVPRALTSPPEPRAGSIRPRDRSSALKPPERMPRQSRSQHQKFAGAQVPPGNKTQMPHHREFSAHLFNNLEVSALVSIRSRC